jgi:hypothetical protein
MFGVYLFTAIVGWLLVAFFLVSGSDVGGDLDFDADIGADLDFDADVGGDVDFDVDVDGDGAAVSAGGVADAILSFFSLRSIVFFMAFFGATGLILRGIGTNPAGTAVAAAGVGLFASAVNTALINYVKRTGVSSAVRDHQIAGSAAKVVLPISNDRKGRVAIDVAGQRLYLVATPFAEKADDTFEVGESVVVVEVERGSAKVARMDALE